MVDGYNNTYDASEMSEATIDLSVSVLSTLAQFGVLIAIVLIFRYLFRKL